MHVVCPESFEKVSGRLLHSNKNLKEVNFNEKEICVPCASRIGISPRFNRYLAALPLLTWLRILRTLRIRLLASGLPA